MKLKSIKAERAACLAAFRKYPHAKRAWCLHHARLYEAIDNGLAGIKERIAYIDERKQRSERARRFHNMRPVKPVRKGTKRTVDLLNKQWPDNTWGSGPYGWSDIFGGQ